ncbi:hypothetical protein D3C86_1131910 [compost metagenome]
MHHRRQEAHVLRELLAQAADAVQQFTVLGVVHQRDQPVAHFQPQLIHHGHVVPTGLGGRGLRLRDRLRRHLFGG